MSVKEHKFLADKMLGRLAKWLRVFGYDTEYCKDKFGAQLLFESLRENRILLTRGKKLSGKRSWQIIYLESDFVGEQLKQLAKELSLNLSLARIFSRCTICNGKINKVADKKLIKELVPQFVFENHAEFYKCDKCGQIYWKGTHFDLIKSDLEKLGLEIK